MYLKNLVKLRQRKKWTQEKLCVESEVKYNTLIKIENDRIKDPRISTVIKLAKALNVSVDVLIGRGKDK
ncbi:helix-turn-helix domain-containing protein [bacterium]